MAVSTSYAPIVYSGNDVTTAFSVTWSFFTGTLTVTAIDADGVETVKTISTHYTVAGGTDANGLPATGAVTMLTAPASGTTLRITRGTPRTQATIYTNNDAFPAKTHESALDKLTLLVQEGVAGAVDEITGDFMQLDASGATNFWDGESHSIRNVIDPTNDQDAATKNYVDQAAIGALGSPVSIANGGTSASTANGAFNALAPTTTRGDLIRRGASVNERVALGTSGYQLQSDGTDAVWAGFLQAGTGTLTRTWQGKARERVSVLDFIPESLHAGIKDASNTTYLTTYIQAASDAVGPSGCLFFPAGTYKSNAVTVSEHRVHWEGEGSHATTLLYVPTANNVFLSLSKGVDVLYQGSMSGFRICSADTTYVKVAIDGVDTSEYSFQDIVINGVGGSGYWTGPSNTSVGFRLRGREMCSFRELEVFADLPIQISKNPNASIDCDHFNFNNCYLSAQANPIVTVDTGLYVSNLSFDGYQAWVVGTHGFYWNDVSAASASHNISFKNVRQEQGTSATAYMFYIVNNHKVQNLSIENCYGGLEKRGVYLRNVNDVVLKNHYHVGATLALDVDSTVARMQLQACFWQESATANVSGQNVLMALPRWSALSPLPPTAWYDTTSNSFDNITRFAGGGILVPNTGLQVRDSGGDNTLTIRPTDDFSADRSLLFNMANANRTVTFSGNPTLSDWFDQSVKTTASPTFATVVVPEGAAPSTPASGYVVAYAKTDGFLYTKDDAGTERLLNNNPAPTFHVHKNGTDQTGIADNTATEVTWTTEVTDIGGYFASNGWTPPAGVVNMKAQAYITGTAAAGVYGRIMIYKNGSLYKRSLNATSTANEAFPELSLLGEVANGTDAYKVYVQYDLTSGTATVAGAAADTFFMGHWVGPAA